MKHTNKEMNELLQGCNITVFKDDKVKWLMKGKNHSIFLSGVCIKKVSPLTENDVPNYNVQFNYSNYTASEPPKEEE